jgi:hypothetical protein
MAGGFSNGFSSGFDRFYIIFLTGSPLHYGRVGQAYNTTLQSDVPSTWSVTSGTLPTGITLDSDGTISGVPTTVQTSEFQVSATYNTDTFYNNYTIVILSSSNITWINRRNSDIFRRLNFI